MDVNSRWPSAVITLPNTLKYHIKRALRQEPADIEYCQMEIHSGFAWVDDARDPPGAIA